MKKSITTALAIVSLFAIGCATTRSTGAQFDDSMITARVGHRLTMDPDVPRSKIDVDTLDRVVTLRGEVPSEMARAEAIEVTARTRGVASVRDRLHVRGAEQEKKKPDGDLGITTRVNNRLIADPDVKATDVDIDTYDGVVTLSGVVEDDAARDEAELLTQQTKGVRAVHNELRVASSRNVATAN